MDEWIEMPYQVWGNNPDDIIRVVSDRTRRAAFERWRRLQGLCCFHVILELIWLEECSIVKSFRLVKSPIYLKAERSWKPNKYGCVVSVKVGGSHHCQQTVMNSIQCHFHTRRHREKPPGTVCGKSNQFRSDRPVNCLCCETNMVQYKNGVLQFTAFCIGDAWKFALDYTWSFSISNEL